MAEIDTRSIGIRIAHYRRMNGVSTDDLADATSGAVSRAVIANIESGRKADVSVVQLLALAAALGVPPVALLLPLEEPEALVTVRPNDDRRAIDTLDWISGTSSEGHQTPAGKNARAILMGVRGYYRSLQQLRKAQSRSRAWDDESAAHSDAEWNALARDVMSWSEDLEGKREFLETLGVGPLEVE